MESYRKIVGQETNAEIVAKRDALLATLADLKKQKKAANAKVRKKLPTPDIDAAIEATRDALGANKIKVKEARAAAKAGTTVQRRAIEEARLAAVKAARQTSGCYWGNYNAVIVAYDTARRRAMKVGGELRLRRFAGEGRIVNQLMGGASAADIFDRVCSQVSIRPATQNDWPKRRVHQNGYILTMNVFTRDRTPRYVSWPLIMDRPFPVDANISNVTVTRRRFGPRRDEWRVSFTCAVQVEPMVHAGPACGIDVGWRRLNHGLRVAVLVDDEGERDVVVLPEKIIRGIPDGR